MNTNDCFQIFRISEVYKYEQNWTEHILIGLENKQSTLAYCVRILHRVDCFMTFNAIFNNISVISLRSVLLVEETGIPGENHRPVASHWQTLSHTVVHLALRFELTTSVVICTDCIGSCKSNYHTITATTASKEMWRY